jgi:hypothetical protein
MKPAARTCRILLGGGVYWNGQMVMYRRDRPDAASVIATSAASMLAADFVIDRTLSSDPEPPEDWR